MNLLNSWDYEEFAKKLTKLINQYNNLKMSEYIKSLGNLEKGIKKQIKIILYQNFPQEAQIKEITNELFSVLENEEEIIQNFNREYEVIFI
jgi:hypothetical protein